MKVLLLLFLVIKGKHNFYSSYKKSWVPLFAIKINEEEELLKIIGYCCSGTGIRISYA